MAKSGGMRVRFRSGDVFEIPFSDGAFGYGRVLLDLRRLAKAGLFAPRCALNGMYGASLLIQIYRTVVMQPLDSFESLRSAGSLLDQFLDRRQIYRGEFQIVGNLPVLPSEIDFPEFVSTYHENPEPHVSFQKGAIVAKVKIDWQECEKLPKGSVSFGLSPDWIQQCIGDPGFSQHLVTNDLRVNSNRKRVLALAGLKPAMTYDQMCNAVGGLKAAELLRHS